MSKFWRLKHPNPVREYKRFRNGKLEIVDKYYRKNRSK
jgi:hypothetical protein